MSQPLSSPLQAGFRFLPDPLPAAPSARLAASLPHREGYGLTTFRRRNRVGLVASLGRWHDICGRGPLKPPHLATYHFGSSLSAASGSDTKGPHLARRTSRPLRCFTWVDPTTPSWLPTTLLLAVAGSAHASHWQPEAEATLFRRLRTAPLPATHAAVGNPWQNRGLCRSDDRTAVTSATSCRTSGWFAI
jgi:hypothetical protein